MNSDCVYRIGRGHAVCQDYAVAGVREHPYVILADSNQYPITVGLSDLLASTPSFNPSVGGGGQSVKIFKPELALATLLAVVPVAVVFVFSQRALVRGLVGGAVKE